MTEEPESRCICRLNMFACPQHPRTWTAQNVGAWWDIKIEPPVPLNPGDPAPSLTPAQTVEVIREAEVATANDVLAEVRDFANRAANFTCDHDNTTYITQAIGAQLLKILNRGRT